MWNHAERVIELIIVNKRRCLHPELIRIRILHYLKRNDSKIPKSKFNTISYQVMQGVSWFSLLQSFLRVLVLSTDTSFVLLEERFQLVEFVHQWFMLQKPNILDVVVGLIISGWFFLRVSRVDSLENTEPTEIHESDLQLFQCLSPGEILRSHTFGTLLEAVDLILARAGIVLRLLVALVVLRTVLPEFSHLDLI